MIGIGLDRFEKLERMKGLDALVDSKNGRVLDRTQFIGSWMDSEVRGNDVLSKPQTVSITLGTGPDATTSTSKPS